jgi:hypothetical protein
MSEILLYSYVEDAPSAAIARKLVDAVNVQRTDPLRFREGFPAVTRGCGQIKVRCPNFLNMAANGLALFVVADLDKADCAPSLIREYFSLGQRTPIALPTSLAFRVAVREIEAWVIADRDAWSNFISIPKANFASSPETLDDPKQHLFNVIRRKGKKRWQRDMLPIGSASIGPRYNEVLCEFIEHHWSSERARMNSQSLDKTIRALGTL